MYMKCWPTQTVLQTVAGIFATYITQQLLNDDGNYVLHSSEI